MQNIIFIIALSLAFLINFNDACYKQVEKDWVSCKKKASLN